jgi:hypothetical protein
MNPPFEAGKRSSRRCMKCPARAPLLGNHGCLGNTEGPKSPFPQDGAGKGSEADEQTLRAGKGMTRKAGAHKESLEFPGSADVPTIEGISGLRKRGGVYTSCSTM